MNTQLKNKTALVTGGTSGIGFHIALALAEEGVQVAIASREPAPLALQSLQAQGGRAFWVQADVSREPGVVQMIQTVVREFGQLDLFVNNAAVAHHQSLTQITTEAWQATLNTNLSACVWSCREVAKQMIPRRQGSILIVGSTAMYTPAYTETVYRITKTALKSLTESAAIELAPYGIRANLLVPGHYRTRLTSGIPSEVEARLRREIPLRRFGDLAQCGYAAVMLLSDALSGYITGAELAVDGGLHLRPLSFLSEEELLRLNLPASD